MLSLWTGQEGPVGATGTGHVSEASPWRPQHAPPGRPPARWLWGPSSRCCPNPPLWDRLTERGQLRELQHGPHLSRLHGSVSGCWPLTSRPCAGGFATPVLFLWSAQNRGWGRGEGPINTTRDPLNREQRVPEGGAADSQVVRTQSCVLDVSLERKPGSGSTPHLALL